MAEPAVLKVKVGHFSPYQPSVLRCTPLLSGSWIHSLTHSLKYVRTYLLGGARGRRHRAAHVSASPRSSSTSIWTLTRHPSAANGPPCLADTEHTSVPVTLGSKQVWQQFIRWREALACGEDGGLYDGVQQPGVERLVVGGGASQS